MRARMPKNFVLEDKLAQHADYIELMPQHYKGRWREACTPLIDSTLKTTKDHSKQDGDQPLPMPSFDELWLDLGCGRGSFAAALAVARPQTLLVALDFEPVSIAYTAQKLAEAQVHNAVCVGAKGEALPGLFASGEVDRIVLNFPTPFPRKKEAGMRLTSPERLADYAKLLSSTGVIQLRTDSQPLFDFTLEMLHRCSWDILVESRDAFGRPELGPSSEYEQRLTAAGCKVQALIAKPSKQTYALNKQDLPNGKISLVDYLPEDLDAVDYVPLGMEGTLSNLRNRAAKLRRKHS